MCDATLQVQYLHPKDGVYPEKVNAGRNAVNANKGRIGENINPVQIKFSGKLVSVQPIHVSIFLKLPLSAEHLSLACSSASDPNSTTHPTQLVPVLMTALSVCICRVRTTSEAALLGLGYAGRRPWCRVVDQLWWTVGSLHAPVVALQHISRVLVLSTQCAPQRMYARVGNCAHACH